MISNFTDILRVYWMVASGLQYLLSVNQEFAKIVNSVFSEEEINFNIANSMNHICTRASLLRGNIYLIWSIRVELLRVASGNDSVSVTVQETSCSRAIRRIVTKLSVPQVTRP